MDVDVLVAAVAVLPLLVGGAVPLFFLSRRGRNTERLASQALNTALEGQRAGKGVDLNEALETVLVKALDSQTDMFARIQSLNLENARLAAEMVQNQLQRRAGRKRAATATRGRGGRMASNCRLCADPLTKDPSVAEIVSHSTHPERKSPGRPAREQRDDEDDEQASQARLDFPAVAVDAAGVAHVDERSVIHDEHGEGVNCGACGEQEGGPYSRAFRVVDAPRGVDERSERDGS